MIDIHLSTGTYIVAVSGGVDSVVLLDLLAKQQGSSKLIVAHFDHGIRSESTEDRKFVQRLANNYNLRFVYDRAELGVDASEAVSRAARYKFLRTLRQTCNADTIITAHHQDDRIESAFINIIRGTGRKGLTSLRSTNDVLRPLINHKKEEIINYANQTGLDWREDKTNNDTKYLRNNLRMTVLPQLSTSQKDSFIRLLNNLEQTNDEIDALLVNIIHANTPRPCALSRRVLLLTDFDEACELTTTWLRNCGYRDFNQRNIQLLVVASKTLQSGEVNIGNNMCIKLTKKALALRSIDR